ncbi:DNA polymerase III subunit gamma/tau [Xanthocytophaga agilis]|uniref:DNA polymerase III subunit gamma/tau n=1 Tax=Xanthocytophaga agilis TaxID=3048010 RepID=A0AAE3R333_9BACT|nr:DNA polymerase III subunit gamma/tau [Xanthocytophaga agilis]MDJ1500712.1 DNA polymerase III subunit gamma/tau [Xanthocytophaga agilis]
MDQFIVSARKYRPSTFDTVVGQSHITTTLKNAIRQQQLAQAFLFCGPRGVGKTTCARILAKTINCQNLTPETEPCNECDSCRSFNASASFNIHELDAASNNSVDDIRNLVDQVRYPPQSGKYKIYIIDEVHMLSNAAFNAFLKTLEEPPSYAIFILATTEKHKIIPTILSRCQIFDFNRIGVNDIASHLGNIAGKESIRAEEEALQLIAQKADGGLRDALSMFDLITTFSTDRSISYKNTIDNLHILDYDYYFRMTESLLNESIPQALLIFNEILQKGFDGHQFMVGLCEHLRNLLVCKDPATVTLLQVAGNVQKKYLAQSGQASVSFLLSALNQGNQCDLNYKTSKNQRLLVELTLMKMAHIPSAIDMTRAVQNGSADLKKKLDTVENPPKTEQKSPLAGGNQPPVNGSTSHGTVSDIKTTPSITPNTTIPTQSVGTTPVSNQPNPNRTNPALKTHKLTPSISLSNLSDTSEKKADDTETVINYGNEPFTPDQLLRQWQAFAKTRSYPTELLILNRGYEFQNGTIMLKLENQIQLTQLNEFRYELLEFLRKRLRNSTIQIQGEIVEQGKKRMVYTNREKFDYLAEKYPVLNDLKSQLGLDMDV